MAWYSFYGIVTTKTVNSTGAFITSFQSALSEVERLNQPFDNVKATFTLKRAFHAWEILRVEETDRIFLITQREFESNHDAQFYALGINTFCPDVKITWEREK